MDAGKSRSDLVQPWREWYTALMGSTTNGKSIVTTEEVDVGMKPAKYGMSQHGTIALDPRTDVDLSKPKVRPVRGVEE